MNTIRVLQKLLPAFRFGIDYAVFNAGKENEVVQYYNQAITPPTDGEKASAWADIQTGDGVKVWTPLEFIAKLTDAEKIAIFSSSDPQVLLFRTMAVAAQEIRTDDPRTSQGLNYLVSVNLLTAERKAAILAV